MSCYRHWFCILNFFYPTHIGVSLRYRITCDEIPSFFAVAGTVKMAQVKSGVVKNDIELLVSHDNRLRLLKN